MSRICCQFLLIATGNALSLAVIDQILLIQFALLEFVRCLHNVLVGHLLWLEIPLGEMKCRRYVGQSVFSLPEMKITFVTMKIQVVSSLDWYFRESF